MRAKKSVDADRIAVIGASKGGELSLLLASMFPEIKVVVAYASGSLIGTGIDREHSGNVSSWSYRGKPLPSHTVKLLRNLLRSSARAHLLEHV
jgi:dienelactone hydrolase